MEGLVVGPALSAPPLRSEAVLKIRRRRSPLPKTHEISRKPERMEDQRYISFIAPLHGTSARHNTVALPQRGDRCQLQSAGGIKLSPMAQIRVIRRNTHLIPRTRPRGKFLGDLSPSASLSSLPPPSRSRSHGRPRTAELFARRKSPPRPRRQRTGSECAVPSLLIGPNVDSGTPTLPHATRCVRAVATRRRREERSVRLRRRRELRKNVGTSGQSLSKVNAEETPGPRSIGTELLQGLDAWGADDKAGPSRLHLPGSVMRRGDDECMHAIYSLYNSE